MVKIAVIDGQGGGIGSLIVKRLKDEFKDRFEIIALGTNAAATSAMMKSRANKGATGENAIVRTSQTADIIMGPLAVIISNSMMGEVTPRMAEAVCSSDARKILIPLTQENVRIIGISGEPLPHLVHQAIKAIKEW